MSISQQIIFEKHKMSAKEQLKIMLLKENLTSDSCRKNKQILQRSKYFKQTFEKNFEI